MNSLIKQIDELLSAGTSVVLIGPTDSGKTYTVKNELLPLLQSRGKRVAYWVDSDHPTATTDADVVIIDETETLIDQDHLQRAHTEDMPYYPGSYLSRVKDWHDLYRKVTQPTLYIITRNADEDVSYLVETLKQTEWGRQVTTIQWPATH